MKNWYRFYYYGNHKVTTHYITDEFAERIRNWAETKAKIDLVLVKVP